MGFRAGAETVKLWILSDLHCEHAGFEPQLPLPDADICVLAGDVGAGGIHPAYSWCERYVLDRMPVIFVPGNHEFYGASMSEERSLWKSNNLSGALHPDFHYLDDQAVELGGIQFLGSTLWTDFDLFGEPMRVQCMDAAKRCVTDFRRISWSTKPDAFSHDTNSRFTPNLARRHHVRSRAWLEEKFSEPWGGKTVVVSHHAPHPRSVHPRFAHDLLSACFASDLSDVMRAFGPDLWIHGHMHHAVDYRVGNTRVICNPRGYPGERDTGFKPDLVIDLEDM